MATSAETAAALAAALLAEPTLPALRALILESIAKGLTDDGRVVVSTGTRGTAISFGSLSDALEAVAKIDAMIAGSGFIASPGEFVSG